jgi:RNA polymerase sigma factor (TIGR02999 family)
MRRRGVGCGNARDLEMSGEVTRLVAAANGGDQAALKDLFESVYGELKRLARHQLAGSAGATLDTTGLVHEAYLKLVNPERLELRDSRHFFVIAAKAMRQIVIDHARRRVAIKRGGSEAVAVTLDDEVALDRMTPDTLLRLDSALDQLGNLDRRLAELVEMRYFAGLSVEQIAATQNLTTRTIHRDWRRARAFLFDAIRSDP